MAYNDSGELEPNSKYTLGSYEFELKVQNTHEAGEEDVVSVFAICRGPDGNRETVPKDFPKGTTVESWSVEANETEASVYAVLKSSKGGDDYSSDLDTSPAIQPIPVGNATAEFINVVTHKKQYISFYSDHKMTSYLSRANVIGNIIAGKRREQYTYNDSTGILDYTYTYNGVTVFYVTAGITNDTSFTSVSGAFINGGEFVSIGFNTAAKIAWTIVYGDASGGEYETSEELIARFAIDLRDADPEDWDDPGDTGEPSKTLHVNVIGASPGNAVGVPLEAEAATVYGSGGKGGNGGGGGAGASTVIIYEFTTDKAGSEEQEAYTRGYGIGGSGGKGGRGGDGCILIFY